MKYKCIKSFEVPTLDEDWCEEVGSFKVKKDSIWVRDDSTNNIGGEVHLDNEDAEWIEITFDRLKEFFVEVIE